MPKKLKIIDIQEECNKAVAEWAKEDSDLEDELIIKCLKNILPEINSKSGENSCVQTDSDVL